MENVIVRLIKTLMNFGLEAFGRYYSLYRAFVVDNNDPDNLQRLKLVIPQVSGTQSYNYWAFPRNVFYGNNYGSQILPQKGDVVWVEFEGGRPEIPIWSHGHPGLKDVQKDVILKEKDCYWFKTPKGNIIKLYDTKNLVHIENPNGEVYEQSDYGHSIVTNKKISLGSLEGSKEPAVLGDTAMDLLNELIADIGEIGIIKTSSGVTGQIKSSPGWPILVEKWKSKFENFKSKTVNLN